MKKLLGAMVIVVFMVTGCFYAPSVNRIADAWVDKEAPEGLPSADLKFELASFYVPPPHYTRPQTGDRHYYNFTVTPEFENALAAYLSGRWEQGLAQCDIILILAESKNSPKLLWQASLLRINALVMLKKHNEAVAETARMEKFEKLAMGEHANQTSRVLRAEARYWAGDIKGSMEDSKSVINSFGDWRFPTSYFFSGPPLDQVELARCATAQVRANIFFGLALVAKGRTKEALPWLELANQTMNNVMYVARHPLYGGFFWPSDEHFWGHGLSSAALGIVLEARNQELERVAKLLARAQEYFDAIGYRAGPTIINALRQAVAVKKPPENK